MIKKLICAIIVLFIVFANGIAYRQCYATIQEDNEIESQINNNIDEQLSNLDTEELDELFSDIVMLSIKCPYFSFNSSKDGSIISSFFSSFVVVVDSFIN